MLKGRCIPEPILARIEAMAELSVLELAQHMDRNQLVRLGVVLNPRVGEVAPELGRHLGRYVQSRKSIDLSESALNYP